MRTRGMLPVLLGDSIGAVSLRFVVIREQSLTRARSASDRDRAVVVEVASANRELDQLMDRYARGEDAGAIGLWRVAAHRGSQGLGPRIARLASGIVAAPVLAARPDNTDH